MRRQAFAKNTKVDVQDSMAAIGRLLEKIGANKNLVIGRHNGNPCVMFTIRDLPFSIRLPDMRPGAQRPEAEERRLWRVLVALVKAKVIAIQEGVDTAEGAFVGDIVMANGTRLIEAVRTRQIPLALPSPAGPAAPQLETR